MRWRAMVKDDRGARVALIGTPLQRFGKSEAADGARERARIEQGIDPMSKETLKASAWAMVIVLPLLVLPMVRYSLGLHAQGLWDVPIGFVAQMAWFVPFVVVARRLMRRTIVRHYAAHARCASCGYGLRGIPVAEDGCTVCPECGAAWRVGSGGGQVRGTEGQGAGGEGG